MGRPEPGPLGEADRRELLIAARRISRMFTRGERPDDSTPTRLRPGRDNWLLATEPRYASEARVLEVVPVSFPRPGLVASVQHASVAPRAVLHVFLSARGRSSSLLEGPAPSTATAGMVDSLLHESLVTHVFYDHWVQVTANSYYVPLDDADYPSATRSPASPVPRPSDPRLVFPRPIAETERRELHREAQQLGAQLSTLFERERETYGAGPIPLLPGPDSWLIATKPRYASEGQLVDIVPVSFPRVGLTVGIRHASLPPRAVLHVFVSAHGGEQAGANLARGLTGRAFYDHWVQVGAQTYYAPLDPDDYPPADSNRQLSDTELRHVYDLVVDQDPRRLGFEHALWDEVSIRELIRLKIGDWLSSGHVRLLCDTLGLSAWRPARNSPSDPESAARWREVELPVIRAQAAAADATLCFAFTADPLARIQLPPQARLPVVAPSWAGRGVTVLSAARDPGGDPMFAAYQGPETPEMFLDFCQRLRHDLPGPLVLVTEPSAARRTATTSGQFGISPAGRLTVLFEPG